MAKLLDFVRFSGLIKKKFRAFALGSSLLLGGALNGFGQCEAEWNACKNGGGICSYATTDATGWTNEPFEYCVQIAFPATGLFPQSETEYQIKNAQVEAVEGLPEGLVWQAQSANPSDTGAVWTAGEKGNVYGIVHISGSPLKTVSPVTDSITITARVTPQLFGGLLPSLAYPEKVVYRLSIQRRLTERGETAASIFQFYPNPSRETFNFSYAATGSVVISNLSGQVVWRQFFGEKGVLQINATDWPKGIYLYTINAAEQVLSGKLVLN